MAQRYWLNELTVIVRLRAQEHCPAEAQPIHKVDGIRHGIPDYTPLENVCTDPTLWRGLRVKAD